MSYFASHSGHRSHGLGRNLGGLARTLMVIVGFLFLTGGPIAYILWPRWPAPVALDAPALPITIAGVPFTVPPAAIRVAMQRRTGAQERIDLVFLWPSLAPPDPAAKPASTEAPQLTDRVFVTIAVSDSTPPPLERLNTIYPRYFAGDPTAGPNGLLLRAFRHETPYQGEDLLYEAAAPENFLVRCTRAIGPATGMCLHERRLANADIIVRFPRDWLSDWRTVASGIDRLIANLRPRSAR
jgi:hypothetical protein